MTTDGIRAVSLATRDRGRAARFFPEPGFEIGFTTDHDSGTLRALSGPTWSWPRSRWSSRPPSNSSSG
jgi:hypothetical protein